MTDTTVEASTSTTHAGDQTTTEATTAEPTATSASTTPESTTPKVEVPESYDLKMPEGVALDEQAATEFTAIAKELKLDQATAQKFADVGAKMAQRQADNHAKLVETWTEQVKTDKDIGGDKLEENLGIARKALDTFGTPELKDVLNATGFGNHPAVIKAFYKIGQAISEDRFVTGGAKGPETDMAKRMFPSMN
jgi:hypothetical protein